MSTRGTRFRAVPLFAALAILSAPVDAADKPEPFKCSARGGPEWREYRSKHFLLDTDLSRDSAALLVKDLERLHRRELSRDYAGQLPQEPSARQGTQRREPGARPDRLG